MSFFDFLKTGLVRLSGVLAPNGPSPVSKVTWRAGARSGQFPQPLKLGPRTTVWCAEDIRAGSLRRVVLTTTR
jgi:hypothetical protein